MISYTDENGNGPRYKAMAEAFENKLKEYQQAGILTYKKIEFSQIKNEIIITATFTVHGETFTKNFVFNEDTDDYKQSWLLIDWGVDFNDAMIACYDNYFDRLYYKTCKTEQEVKTPLGGLLLTLDFWSNVATIGEASTIKLGFKQLLSRKELGKLLSGILFANDVSSFLNGENFSTLERIGIDPNTLKKIALISNTLDFINGLEDAISLSLKNATDEYSINLLKTALSEIQTIKQLYKLMEPEKKPLKSPTKTNGTEKRTTQARF